MKFQFDDGDGLTISATRGEEDWVVSLNYRGHIGCEPQAATKVWSDLQMGAVAALAIGGENSVELDELLRAIAEPAVEGLSRDLQPVP